MKSKTLILITLVISIINTTPLLAGDDKIKGAGNAAGHVQGNGGDVVYCPRENGNPSVELLDLYEARARWKLTLDLGPDVLTPIEKVHFVIDRLQRIDHPRAEYYRKKANEFFDNALFLSGITLIDVPDSQFTYIPSHCEIRQIAIQKTPQFPGEMLYTLSEDLWNLLDNNNKAGVILHEIVYGEAINYLEHIDSINTRYFMGHVASHFMSNLSKDDYINLFKVTKFLDPGIEIDGVIYNMDKLVLFEDGSVKSGSLYYPKIAERDIFSTFSAHLRSGGKEQIDREIDGDLFTFESEIEFYQNGNVKKGILYLWIKGHEYSKYLLHSDHGCTSILFDHGFTHVNHWIEFSEEGKLKKLLNADSASTMELINPNSGLCYSAGVIRRGYPDQVEPYIDFFENGMVEKMSLATPANSDGRHKRLPVYQKEIEFATGTITTFHDNGYVASDIIRNDETLHTNKGDIRVFKGGTLLNFNREGKVIVD